MADSVKTSGDWMSLFLGSREPRSSRDHLAATSYAPRTNQTSYASKDSLSSYSTRDSSYPARRESSRYMRDPMGSDYSGGYSSSGSSTFSSGSSGYSGSSYSRAGVTSPSTYRSAFSHRPSYSSRWSEPEHEHEGEAPPSEVEPKVEPASSRRPTMLQTSKSRSTVTVLNEGTIVIRRAGAGVGDDSSEDEETEPEDDRTTPSPSSPSPPPRDPLEVEEEELTNKLQTAGFLMSLPEEEAARRRLVEIRQMRENPELFKPENSRDWKFSQVSSELAKPSVARAEEEKILILRLSSRGISEVEQTDIQVRLQELWRDRREELDRGVARLEQEYEHLLTESSTEVSELDGSIRGKQATILKLQEEILVLSLRKDKLTQDMEKVSSVHQQKLEELKTELAGLEEKSCQYSVVSRSNNQTENSLPEDERSEIEAELECPVCLEISRPPIYQCGEGHIVCSACKPLLKTCCLCEVRYSDPPIRCRFAEKLAAKYFRQDEDQD